MLLKRLVFGVAAAALVAAGGTAAQASYPERPITMIVAYSAGGGTDVLARTIAPFLEKHLGDGARFAVVNRPGAGGEIGFTATAQARPDGYTIGFINVPAIVNPLIEREPEYSLDDFTFLANMVSDPASIVVNKASPFQSLEEWMAYVKENPRTMPVGNSALGGAMHTSLLRFLRSQELEVIHVPFPGSAPSRTALMGGHVASSVFGLGEAGPFHAEGELRILATMAAERWDLVPDVPTFRELGINVVSGSFRGLAAPAGLPDDVREKLLGAIRATFDDEDFQEAARKQVLPLEYVEGDDYRDMVKQIHADMAELWEVMPWRR